MRETYTARYTDDTPHDIPDGIPMPVPEAAKILGISPEAVRNRLSRGTLNSVKEGGRVFVLINRDMAQHTERSTGDMPPGTPSGMSGDVREIVEEMRSRIEDLREQLAEEREARRRADAIIMQLSRANASLAARLPELEALQEAPETHVTAREYDGHDDGPQNGAEGTVRRPWWVRWFGG